MSIETLNQKATIILDIHYHIKKRTTKSFHVKVSLIHIYYTSVTDYNSYPCIYIYIGLV